MQANKWPQLKSGWNGLLGALLLLATCAACAPTDTPTPATPTPAVAPTATTVAATPIPQNPVATTAVAHPTAKASAELASLTTIIEEEAKSYPTSSAPGNFPDSLKNAVGTPQRKCVDVEMGRNDELAVTRSGEFILQTLIPKYTKIAWSQWHLSETTVLTVKALKVGSPNTTLSFGPFRAVIDGWGYPSAIDLPGGATWVLVATADVNWGCFIITMP